MSLQMRLVHARKGLTPPALHTEEAARDMAAHAPQQDPMPASMRARFTATSDKGVTRVVPKQGLRSGGALIFLHGGAYLFPLVAGQWGIIEGLIDRTGLPVIIPDYPLAPNHTATEAFDFVQPIIDEAQAEFGRVILFGDSAGGGLAVSLAMQRRDAGQRQVDGLVLYAPWVDVTMTNPAIEEVQHRDKILRVPGLAWAGRAWAGDLDPADWRVSPLYGDPAGLPPMRIFPGGRGHRRPRRHRVCAQGRPRWRGRALARGAGRLPRVCPGRSHHSRGRGRPQPQRSLHLGDPHPGVTEAFHGLFHGLVDRGRRLQAARCHPAASRGVRPPGFYCARTCRWSGASGRGGGRSLRRADE